MVAARPGLFHFRDRDGIEVDLVLESGDGRVVGVGVKAGATVRAEDLRGLRLLEQRLGTDFAAGVVLCPTPAPGRAPMDTSAFRVVVRRWPVFHGYDERPDWRAAVKLLRPPTASVRAEILDALRRDRKRFLRKIRTTAQLEHPGTPAVYDTGVETAPDGGTQLWLVMQLLRGSTLEACSNRADYTG